MSELDPKPASRAPSARRSAPLLALLALFLVIAGTVASVNRAGLCGVELENAELARRIAHGVFGASELGLSTDASTPTRGEVGRGELPFLAMALGFRCFGLSAWAARLPLASIALVGLAALYFAVARLVSKRAGWLAVLALGAAPLFFLEARTLLGDSVTSAANTLTMAGLCLALFERRANTARWAGLAMAVLGVAAGSLSRGVLLGAAAPSLGVGVAFIALTFAGRESDRFAARVAACALATGIVSAVAGVLALELTSPDVYSMWLGSSRVAGATPSFDIALAALPYALFPWSALLPPAIGRALWQAKPARPGREQDLALRLCALSTGVTTLVIQTALAPLFGPLPFAAPAACAVLIALALHDLDLGAAGSRWLGLFVAAALVLIVLDVRSFPNKALVPLAALDLPFPASFAKRGFAWFAAVGAVLSLAFLFIAEAPPGFARASRFRRADYAAWPKFLSTHWSGLLWFGVLTLGSALLGFELILLLSDRHLHWGARDGVGETTRLAVRAGWLLVAAFCAGPPLVLLGRDVLRSLLDPGATLRCAVDGPLPRLPRFGRGSAAAVLFALGGAALSFGYYPALMQRLSPQGAFERFRREAKPGEPLGLLHVDAAGARYEAGILPRELSDVDSALDWLLAPGPRRFLGFRGSDLASLNAGYRARSSPRRNLPLLDASASEMLLAVSSLPAGASERNPLARDVLTARPAPTHPLSADLAGKLEVIGWDLQRRGRDVESLSTGTDYELTLFFSVREPLAGEWQVFIHIDGLQQRYNGDHALLAGKYPPSLWLPGDFIADRHVIHLPPNFRSGSYRLLFGLFDADHRLEVRHGLHEDDRVVAGTLTVR